MKINLFKGSMVFLWMIIGSIIFVSLVMNFPVPNGEDVNDDGISDNFQKVKPVEDVLKDDEGWRIEVVGYTSEPDVLFISFSGAVLVILIPAGVALWQMDGPRRQDRYSKWHEEGKMHDHVRRIAAFLEINPSLSSAMKLTRISLPEKDQATIGTLIWSSFTEGVSFDEKYDEFSREWTARAPAIGSALNGLASAEKESGQAEVMISARSVVERLSEASNTLMENYSRSLSGPTTALFGMGVLLPILLATMIPVAGITGRTTLLIGVLLWIVLPAGIMMAGSHLVLKRPSLGTMERKVTKLELRPGPTDIISLSIGLCSLILTIAFATVLQVPSLISKVGLDSGPFRVLTCFIGISFTTAGIIAMLSRSRHLEDKRYQDVRARSPRIIHDISSSVQEGHSFEYALKGSMSQNEVGAGQKVISLPGTPLKDSLIPEPLRSYLESSKDFSKAGKGPGGRAIRAFSRHIRELLELENDLSSKVKNSVGQMEMTASVFAPLMIGTSAGIFSLMDKVGEKVPQGTLFSSTSPTSMEPAHFLILAGGYLFILSMVTTLTIFRLEKGRITGGWHRVPKRLVQSSLAFSAGVIISSMLLG